MTHLPARKASDRHVYMQAMHVLGVLGPAVRQLCKAGNSLAIGLVVDCVVTSLQDCDPKDAEDMVRRHA